MPIDDATIDALFREARNNNKFRDEPVSDDTLRALFDILKWGPTSANCSPARFLFLRTKEAKERIGPALSSGNRAKTLAAPVCVVVAYDPKFYEKLPQLFPANADATKWFTSNESFAATTAFRNGTLQGAYLMIAAHLVGLDVGGMSGFDNAKVDAEFFSYSGWRSNFLVNLGHGDPEGVVQPRPPRLSFDEACQLL